MTDKATLAEIKEYMKRGDEHRENVKERLATITAELATIKASSTKCDTERSDHLKRLTSLETSRSNFFAVAASWAAAIPLLSGVVSWFATKHT